MGVERWEILDFVDECVYKKSLMRVVGWVCHRRNAKSAARASLASGFSSGSALTGPQLTCLENKLGVSNLSWRRPYAAKRFHERAV